MRVRIICPDTVGGVLDFGHALKDELCGLRIETTVEHLSSVTGRQWQGDHVLLQYSGYGYQKRGVPLRLLRLVSEARSHWRSFGVYFHELYAFSSPRYSAFWLSPLQRYIARQLFSLSDYAMTNRELSSRWLSHGNECPVRTLAVFSTVGELAASQRADIAQRHGTVVFGSSGLRKRAYDQLKLLESSDIAQLGPFVDVGNPIDETSFTRLTSSLNILPCGRLQASEVAKILQTSRFGVVAYPKEYIAKSSVFASYCAFGLVPVLFSDDHSVHDGLKQFKHYLPMSVAKIDYSEIALTRIAREANDWYLKHSLTVHANAVASKVREMAAS
jgi:hypothetical protein